DDVGHGGLRLRAGHPGPESPDYAAGCCGAANRGWRWHAGALQRVHGPSRELFRAVFAGCGGSFTGPKEGARLPPLLRTWEPGPAPASAVAFEQLPPDQHAPDFVGAGADGIQLRVAQDPPGRVL